MNRKLTLEQIRSVCLLKLGHSRSPTVQEVVDELRHQYGCSGRRERVSKVLRTLVDSQRQRTPDEVGNDITSLRQRLSAAEQRADRAEQLERHHQDFWARRYQEKLAELQGHAPSTMAPGVTLEQHLELYELAAELARRLAKYEEVLSLDPPGL